MSPATLPEALERAARSFPERGVSILDGRGRSRDKRSYPELLRSVQEAAGRWGKAGLAPGEVVLVALPTGWDWFDAWLGALWLGALPVATAPLAGLGGAAAHARRLAALREGLETRFLVQGPDDLPTGGGRSKRPRAGADDVAFLQLTSGSSGVPRAVRISHRAALHNARAIDIAIGAPHGAPAHTWATSVVSWLPLHHDMGLVGCFIFALLGGFDLFLLTPASFLARPHVWLERLGRHGTALSPAPNFGYQLCVERCREHSGLDLSHWRAAMIGAEMIRPETVAAFSDMFGPYGFAPEALRPCYGLAEATLAVTFDQKGAGVRSRPAPDGRDVVCVGRPVLETEICVCGPRGRPLSDGQVGEVQVKGPGLFSGYQGEGDFDEAWLATGDLGFVLHGELYLTGRSKDILIIRGFNIMPHEIEWVAHGVTGGGGVLRAGAFAVARGAQGEEAVLVVEVDPSGSLDEMAAEIRRRVGRELSLPLADLVFVRRGKIPKTTSGKVQRLLLRDRYLRGELETL